jgi:hypothetical protein
MLNSLDVHELVVWIEDQSLEAGSHIKENTQYFHHKIDRLMMLKEIIPLYSENKMNRTDMLLRWNVIRLLVLMYVVGYI